MEKAMAPHSSTLAWKIPWTEEPGRLQSVGSLRVRHDWVTSLSLFSFMHWRRKGQPTPVLLPGESQGRGSLMSCRLWGHNWSDLAVAVASTSRRTEIGDRFSSLWNSTVAFFHEEDCNYIKPFLGWFCNCWQVVKICIFSGFFMVLVYLLLYMVIAQRL